MKIKNLGCPGHFIAVASCHFRLHSQIGGKYRVSTVGNYYPGRDGKRDTIGSGDDSFFETMVFKTLNHVDPQNDGCGCYEVADYSGLEQIRAATAGEATKIHERMVRKYAK